MFRWGHVVTENRPPALMIFGSSMTQEASESSHGFRGTPGDLQPIEPPDRPLLMPGHRRGGTIEWQDTCQCVQGKKLAISSSKWSFYVIFIFCGKWLKLFGHRFEGVQFMVHVKSIPQSSTMKQWPASAAESHPPRPRLDAKEIMGCSVSWIMFGRFFLGGTWMYRKHQPPTRCYKTEVAPQEIEYPDIQ